MPASNPNRFRAPQDIYGESVELARQAQLESKLGPKDVVHSRPRQGRENNWWKTMVSTTPIISGSDMTANEYEKWVTQKKAEGWTDWKASKPMSSEDLKQIRAARRKNK